MRHQQPQRHAIAVVAHQQHGGRRRLLPRCAVIGVAGAEDAGQQRQQPGPPQRRRSQPSHLRRRLGRDGCGQPGHAKVAGQSQRLDETEALRPLGELGPKAGLCAEVPQQSVQINQVAHAVTRFRIKKQMRCAVQHLVNRMQHLPGRPARRLQPRQQQACIDVGSGHRRQDVVVQVKLHAVRRMPHRRGFVTQRVVVMPVVRVEFNFLPADALEPLLGVGQMGPWHQNVGVRRQPSFGNRQPLPDIGRAFEQHQRVRWIANGIGHTVQCPCHGRQARPRQLKFSHQMPAGRRGHLVEQRRGLDGRRQARQQAQPPRNAKHMLPIGQRPVQGRLGRTQRRQPAELRRPSRPAHGGASTDPARPAACLLSTCGQTASMASSAPVRSL